MNKLDKILSFKLDKIYCRNPQKLALFYESEFTREEFKTEFKIQLKSFYQALFGSINIYLFENTLILQQTNKFFGLINIKTSSILKAFEENYSILKDNSSMNKNQFFNFNKKLKKNEKKLKKILSKKFQAEDLFIVKESASKLKIYIKIRNYDEINGLTPINKKFKNFKYAAFDVEKTETTIVLSYKTRLFVFLFEKISEFLDRFVNRTISKILNLLFFVQAGIFRCGIKAIVGFIFIQLFCKEKMDNKIENENEKYKKNKKNKINGNLAREAIKALRYSCASYLELPFRMMVPGKIRDVKNNNPNVKHILDRAYIDEKDIIKIHKGGPFSIAYCCFIDSSFTVISFRGISRTNDIFKILNASYVPFLNGYVHEGLYELALEFINNHLNGLIKEIKKRQAKPLEIIIKLTGHSMGGAISILVYLILKNYNMFQDKLDLDQKEISNLKIKVLVFSVPPIVSKEVAKTEFKDITVFNYDNDIIPRLSVGSILDFKYFCISVGQRLLNFDIKPQDIFEIRNFVKNADIHEKLFCPGRIYHIESHKENKKTCYNFLETEPMYYGELTFTMRFVYDHLLNRYLNAFLSILEDENHMENK